MASFKRINSRGLPEKFLLAQRLGRLGLSLAAVLGVASANAFAEGEPLAGNEPTPTRSRVMVRMGKLPTHTRTADWKEWGYVTLGSPDSVLAHAWFKINDRQMIEVVPDAAQGGIVQAQLHLMEGQNTVELIGVDRQGVLASQVQHVKVDRTSPALRILSPMPGESLVSQDIQITFEVVDDSPVKLSVNGHAASRVDAGSHVLTLSLPLERTGPSTLSVVAIDEAGNYSRASVSVILACRHGGSMVGTCEANDLQASR